MKKKTMIVTGLLATLTLGMTAGALASSSLTEVKAFLNPGVQVNTNGKILALKDEQGKTVTPLTYNDSIYLPIRGVAGGLGYQVYWDGANNTAFLEKNSEYLTFRADEKLIQDKYGYTLQIPASLGGKIRPVIWPQETLQQGMESGKLSKNVVSATDILYLPIDTNLSAIAMATIEVVKQSDWDTVAHDDKDTVLGSRGDFTYVLHNALANTFAPQSEDYSTYQQIKDQFTDNQYDLVLTHPISINPSIVSQLVGKWTEQRKATLMELTIDGVLYRAGVAVGNYLILDSEHIEFVADKQISTVSFKVDGDTLEMGGQTFKKTN